MLKKILSFFLFLTIIGSTAPPGNAQDEPVQTGIDVLQADDFAALQGRRVGLITNQTGRTRDGRSTVDVLFNARGVKLVALFGPEHGVRGTASAGSKVASSRDSKTGLPIYSLYGSSRKPTASMMRGIDTLVFDIQDIGSRSYTFISTMGGAMETAAALGKSFVVLDRPNPIGDAMEGNITESQFRSFVSPYPIPYRHGLTVGELARMLNGRGWLKNKKACKLSVIPMRGYRRDMFWADTGLPWVATSPNIPRSDSPFYYAATGIVGELSALSIGIGTNFQFQLAGAPGLDANALVKELGKRHLPGFEFKAVSWRPKNGAYRGKTCNGAQIFVADPGRAQLTRLNFELMGAVKKIAPRLSFFGGSKSQSHMFDLVCGTDDVRRLFQSGESASTIWWAWNKNAKGFTELRKRYLLYD